MEELLHTQTASIASQAATVATAVLATDCPAKRLRACVEAFFWSLRDAGLAVDMVEVVRFSDV